MKYLILVAAILLAGCDDRQYTVVCMNAFSPTGVEVFSPERVNSYVINDTGTTIYLNGGNRVDYPSSVECKGTMVRK